MKEITKRRVLEEMLLIYGSLQRFLSKGLRNEIPEDGFDAAFFAMRERAEVIREMMRGLENDSDTNTGRRNKTLSVLRTESGDHLGKEISVLAGGHDEAGRSMESYLQTTGMYPIQVGTEILQEPEGSCRSMEQEER